MAMQADIAQISRLVVDLLKQTSPERAARLKQRLNTALVAGGFDRFDEKSFGSKRFKDFLEKHLCSDVVLALPEGPGDIQVSLRRNIAPAVITPPESKQSEVAKIADKPVVRPDVWQAFVNQDLERKRFFDKVEGRVVHFRSGEPASVKNAVEATPGNYAEIVPIPADLQVDWFKSFLQKNPPHIHAVAEVIQKLLDENLGTQVLDSISQMLGPNTESWRAQRTRLIYSKIVSWCEEHGIDVAMISSRPKPLIAESTAVDDAVVPPPSSVRKQAQAILDSLPDADIAQIVLPILVSTVLVKARL